MSHHAWSEVTRFPWVWFAHCLTCGVFVSVRRSDVSFLRVKPAGFGLRHRDRYVRTHEEPTDCYRAPEMPATPPLLEAPGLLEEEDAEQLGFVLGAAE